MVSLELTVTGLPAQSFAYTNCIYGNFDDFMTFIRSAPKGLTSKEAIKSYGLNVLLNDRYVFAFKPYKDINPGTICMGSMQRQSSNLAMNQACKCSVYIPKTQNIALSSITFEMTLAIRGQLYEAKTIDCKELSKLIEETYQFQLFSIGQLFAVEFTGLPIRLKCTNIQIAELNTDNNNNNNNTNNDNFSLNSSNGQLIQGTSISFTKAKDAPIKLINQTSSGSKGIFKPDFDFSKLGIGGLDKEFNDIFRRAFASRVFPSDIIKQMGINHVRGMLLHGPPGCGKTLIARQIGKVLNAKEPKVVNGPEILDKFVGESERKVRELFSDARKEQEELGEDSELHIIIFDEIDAICKQRGSSRDGTGVGDSVVNQLLTQIDGVDSLNNVLVIGMTNRKDMLDDALMRPGRLEVQIEINLPDEKGRGQILKIHTENARKHGFLDPDLMKDLDTCINYDPNKKKNSNYMNLAQRTKNFSGAEIEGLVRAATSHSLSHGTDGKTFHAVQNFRPVISLDHFNLALEEIVPKFGMPKDGLEHLYRYGMINYSKEFTELQKTISSLLIQVKNNEKTSHMSLLLHGHSGTGKTALAAFTAAISQFPFIRLISANDLIGMMESSKSSKLVNTFQEAYRSPLSLIILDDMEQLIEYVALGPRFSNQVLQTLKVLVKSPPPVLTRKLMIIGITNIFERMEELGLTEVFDVNMEVPKLKDPVSIRTILEESEIPIDNKDLATIVSTFTQPVAVKKLLMITELARMDAEVVTAETFIDCVYKLKL